MNKIVLFLLIFCCQSFADCDYRSASAFFFEDKEKESIAYNVEFSYRQAMTKGAKNLRLRLAIDNLIEEIKRDKPDKFFMLSYVNVFCLKKNVFVSPSGDKIVAARLFPKNAFPKNTGNKK